MFAFKVLNLSKGSSRLIFILLSLSLGLFSLLVSSGYNPCFLSFPFFHLPFFLLTFTMLSGYILSGDAAYRIYYEKKKEKSLSVFSFLIIYIIILIYPFFLFKACFFFPCLILSLLALFTFFKALRNRIFSKSLILWVSFSILEILYFSYIAVFSIFIF